MAVKKGLACGSYVAVMLPPSPATHSIRLVHWSRRAHCFRWAFPCLRSLLGPRGRPFPPTLPSLPSAFTVSEPPWGSTRYSFCLPAADTLTWRRGWRADRSATWICTEGASPPAPPSWPFEPSVPFEPSPPAAGLFGSMEPMLPLVPSKPSLPFIPLEPLLPEKFEMKLCGAKGTELLRNAFVPAELRLDVHDLPEPKKPPTPPGQPQGQPPAPPS